MATLTIRDLDDTLKQRLRLRAAHHARSMEEEARQILRTALEPAEPAGNLADRIRARFAGLGDVRLPIAEREAVRPPPDFEPPARPKSGTARRPKTGSR